MWTPLVCLVSVLVGVLAASAQEAGATPAKAEISEFLKPGIVVEKVIKGSEAEKAGIREGDILLSWSRGEEHGTIETPFDLDWLEIEQAPRGSIILIGARSEVKQNWIVTEYESHPDYGVHNAIAPRWGLEARPNIVGDLALRFAKGTRLIQANMNRAAATQWKALAADTNVSQSKWLASWLLARAATALASQGRNKESEELYEESIHRSQNGDPIFVACLLRRQARFLYLRGYWSKTKRSYLQALALDREKCRDCLSVATDLSWLSGAIQLSETADQAKSLALEAFALEEKSVPYSRRAIGTLAWLASLSLSTFDLASAEQYSIEGIRLSKSLDVDQPDRMLGAHLNLLSNVAWYRGDLANAEIYSNEAFEIYQSIQPGGPYSAAPLTILGLIAWDRGELSLSESYFRRALTIAEHSGLVNLDVYLNDLGMVACDRGRYTAASTYFHRALRLERVSRTPNIVQAGILDNLAVLAQKQGRLREAQKLEIDAVRISRRLSAGVHEAIYIARLGEISELLGRPETANKLLREALRIQENSASGSELRAQILMRLAHLSRRTTVQANSHRYFQEAEDALESHAVQLGGSEDAHLSFRAKFKAYYAEFIDLLITNGESELAFETLERSRARTLLETLSRTHSDIRKGVDPPLLQRERTLQAEIKGKSELRIRLLGEKNSEEQLKAIEKQISDLNSEYQEVEGRIRSTSPAYAALTQPQPLKAKEIQQQLLDPDTLLLEYSLGEERSYVFAVTPDSLEAFQLPKRAEIEKAAKQVYRLLTARNRTIAGETAGQRQVRMARAEAAYPQAAARLSQMILGPIALQLQSKRLLVVADGALQYIPFALLMEPNTEQHAKPIPLVVKHEIVHLPSASVLAVLRQEQMNRKPAPKAVAVLADPVFDKQDSRVSARTHGSSASVQAVQAVAALRGATEKAGAGTAATGHDWLLATLPSTSSGLLTRSAADVGLSRDGQLRLPRLRFSREEASEIMAVTPKGEGMEAVDFAANRATATSPELGQYRIVHFATHGLLDSEHPELSGLVLSLVDKNGKPQDGFLTLSDIYNLNLPADLVVLSACETGLGKEISGEGLIGLTRGFMYAGASRVVASLWKVSDAATAQLMAEFYRAMEKDGMAPAAALRAAQVKMWKQKRWSSPYYWAAFEIQGEWK